MKSNSAVGYFINNFLLYRNC